ncbi:hypothetical protein BaRGS_00013565 [Batillaria attramentaria]|uniref:Uncharacterized protein n=1 Tax=Batillaria attramentaria TaxID=370345 RepID=A0ABD0L747_9CAEN
MCLRRQVNIAAGEKVTRGRRARQSVYNTYVGRMSTGLGERKDVWLWCCDVVVNSGPFERRCVSKGRKPCGLRQVVEDERARVLAL